MSQDLSHYDAVIADLEAQRDQLNATIEMLKRLKAIGGPIPPPNPASTAAREASGVVDLPHDAFFGMTIPDAAKKYLGLIKKTQPLSVLCDALLNGGLKTTSANFRETVRSVLSRQPDFVRVNSEWGLADWYPAMRKERKPRSGQNRPEQEKAPEELTEDASGTKAA